MQRLPFFFALSVFASLSAEPAFGLPELALGPEHAVTSANQFPSDLEVGRQLEAVGDFDGAITSYRKALESPDASLRTIALDLITKAISKKRQKEEKEDAFKAYLSLGDFWKQHNKTDEAIAAYEKALGSKSDTVRASATSELAALIGKKTTWWREFLTSPLFALAGSLAKPIFVTLAVFVLVIIARACIRRTDLLVVPNPAVSDTRWLEILIQDYDHRAKRIHGLPSRKSGMSLITFGSAGELFADLLSRITQVESGLWRQRLVRFLQKPRFELELSLPSNSEGGIVTATISSQGKIKARFIKDFSKNDFPAMQRDLAFWVAYQVRYNRKA